MMQVEFINFNPNNLLHADQDSRRKVRVQVMRNFRRNEREQRQRKHTPAAPNSVCTNVATSSRHASPTESVWTQHTAPSSVASDFTAPDHTPSPPDATQAQHSPQSSVEDFAVQAPARQTSPPETTQTSYSPPHNYNTAMIRAAATPSLRKVWTPSGRGCSKSLNSLSDTNLPVGVAPVIAVSQAIKLLQFGSAIRQDHVVAEGQEQFSLAISCLRQAFNGKHPELTQARLMVISMGISMSEMYSAISYDSGEWTWHTQVVGMSNLILAHSPKSQGSELGDFMFQNFRTAQLMHSLTSRKPFSKAYAAPAIPSGTIGLDALLDLAFKVAPLLADADSLLHPKQPKPQYQKQSRQTTPTIQHLIALHTMLTNWLQSFRGKLSRRPDEPRPRNVGTTVVDRSRDWRDCCYAITHPQASPELFNTVAEALCRICLLLVCQSLADLGNLENSSKSSGISSAMAQRWTDETHTCATNLGTTISSLVRAAGTDMCRARVVCAPLWFLAEWFSREGDADGVSWCAEVKRSVAGRAEYLNWEALIPWSLLPLVWVPGGVKRFDSH